ncbi:MAG TPA: DUF1015 domain-containing protein, partial [Bacteroidales bacterium]
MAILKAFKGIRPVKDKAARIASRPYDVLNREEAKKEATDEYSFLHVIKPEIDLPDSVDEHDERVYQKGKDNFFRMISDRIMVQDKEECLYIYAQTMNGRTQYGIVGCAAVEDYMNNIIRKHELTRPDKEEDRKKHVRISGMNYEPVFFAYPANKELDEIVAKVIKAQPEYDFTAVDGFGHHFWTVTDKATINRIIDIFKTIKYTYVADGHHRTAAAALVGNERKQANPNHTGKEEYNYFLAVHFPDNQLAIMDYNRVIKDLNGMSESELLKTLEKGFTIEEKGTMEYRPTKLHNFSMYLGGKWYSLTAKPGTYNDNDPIGCLDVTVLSDLVL